MTYHIDPIGFIQSPYKEKFAVPRQPRLAPSATSRIKLVGEANSPEAIRGIEQFSHLWLLFLFDQNLEAGWRPTVRPPRLGGMNVLVCSLLVPHFVQMALVCLL